MADVERARMHVSLASTDALLDPLKVRAGVCGRRGRIAESPERISRMSSHPPRRRTEGSPPRILPRAQALYLSLADADGTMTRARALFALAGPSPTSPRGRERGVFRSAEDSRALEQRSSFAKVKVRIPQSVSAFLSRRVPAKKKNRALTFPRHASPRQCSYKHVKHPRHPVCDVHLAKKRLRRSGPPPPRVRGVECRPGRRRRAGVF